MTDRTAGNDGPTPRGRSDRRVECLIALAILCLTGPLIQRWTAQPAARYTLTVAAVDDRSFRLDPYVGVLGDDRARFDGHTYSDKAPYQPLLATPAYAAFRAFGGRPFPIVGDAQVVNRSTHVGLWWVTFWSATIPAIVLTIGVRRMVAQVAPEIATAVALSITLGSTMLPFTSWLFGHVLAAMWVMLAWAAMRHGDPGPRTCVMAGACLGAGIGTEYPVAVIALIVLVATLLGRRWRGAAWLSIGTATATIPMLIYNWLVFRNPFEVSYQGHLPNFQGSGAFGVFNLTLPRADELARALVSDRGLFVLTPVMLLAVVGCILVIAEGQRLRRDGWVGLTALLSFLVLSTGIDGLGGDSPGPRYLIPVFPLLALPLAAAWRRLPLVCAATACVGTVTMWIAAVTIPDIASTVPNAPGTWLQHLWDGQITPNILTGRDHRWIIFLTSAAGVIAAVAALRASRVDHASTEATII